MNFKSVFMKKEPSTTTKPSDNLGFTAEMARDNLAEYQKDLIKQREEYKKELCNKIAYRSRQGQTVIFTYEAEEEDFVTYEYLEELTLYFRERGFKVEPKHGVWATRLRISWDKE